MAGVDGIMWRILDSIADRGLALVRGRSRAHLSSIKSLCRDLLSQRGEAVGTALARELVERYASLGETERLKFFLSLLNEFLPDPKEVVQAAATYEAEPNAEHLCALFQVAESPRQELFRRINLAPRGTAALIRIRQDLLNLLPSRPELRPVDVDLQHLLMSWFNRGFLSLQRIEWRTPALILEKIIHHEAVHEIHGWQDLRRRLERDRRCFSFFHPALPDEPLIFVEVALTRGLPTSIEPLLDYASEPLDPARADTAVFYSISNCLDGLRGISFGSFLIKQVIVELEAEELPLKNFVTLSPIPGFRAWMDRLSPERRTEILGEVNSLPWDSLSEPNWHEQAGAEKRFKKPLLRLCAHYLMRERESDRALDPVAAFHLGNGAAIERINWLGDPFKKGLSQSAGLMVNYSYRPSQIEKNHEAYVNRGEVAASAAVKELVRGRR